MATAVLIDGGVVSDTNISNGTSSNHYFSFSQGLNPGTHGASLIIDTITAGSAVIQFSNDTLTDSNPSLAGTNDYSATAAQLNALTWMDLTSTFSVGGTSTITAAQAINFNSNISYRFMRVIFTSTNATNSFRCQFRKQ